MARLDDNEVFRRRITNAGFWWESGANLLTAADTLWSFVEPVFNATRVTRSVEIAAKNHRDAYFLVAGCALESLLKAVRVRQLFPRTGEHAASVMPVLKLPPGVKNKHDLVRLARDAGIAFSYNEEQLVGRLSIYVRWAGRYPVPTSPEPQAPNYVIDRDHQVLNSLVDRIRATYDSLPRQMIMLDGSS
jgi:hypothetical protein